VGYASKDADGLDPVPRALRLGGGGGLQLRVPEPGRAESDLGRTSSVSAVAQMTMIMTTVGSSRADLRIAEALFFPIVPNQRATMSHPYDATMCFFDTSR